MVDDDAMDDGVDDAGARSATSGGPRVMVVESTSSAKAIGMNFESRDVTPVELGAESSAGFISVAGDVEAGAGVGTGAGGGAETSVLVSSFESSVEFVVPMSVVDDADTTEDDATAVSIVELSSVELAMVELASLAVGVSSAGAESAADPVDVSPICQTSVSPTFVMLPDEVAKSCGKNPPQKICAPET